MSEFHPNWEAKIIEEHIVANGVWFYDNEIPYNAELFKSVWNYKSTDLALLDEILEIPFLDYIDYKISDEGVLYYWRFSNGVVKNKSPSFSTYFEARDHINSYGTKYEINW